MVERLTWKKLAWELAFFLHPLGDSGVDIRLYAVVAFGCHGFAACVAFA